MPSPILLARYFNRTLTLTALLLALSTCNYGFDNQAFSTTESMDAFTKTFGVATSSTSSTSSTSVTYGLDPVWLSLFNSVNYVGFALGVVGGSLVSGRWGRVACVRAMSCWALMSATVCVTARGRGQIMAGRVLNYVYVGMELSVVPTFQSEIVPAPARGLVVGTYQLAVVLGGLVINAVCHGTAAAFSGDAQWRLPLGLFYVIPSLVLAGSWLIPGGGLPESPRWLLRQGRVDEARRVLWRLREGALAYGREEGGGERGGSREGSSGDDGKEDHNGNENEEENTCPIEAEFGQLLLAAGPPSPSPSPSPFLSLFHPRTLPRTLIVIALNLFQQLTGQAFASQYGAVYVRTGLAGSALAPTLFTLIASGVSAATILLSLLLADHYGRRALLLLSSGVTTLALLGMGVLGLPGLYPSTGGDVPPASQRAIIALLLLFGVGFGLGWGPLTYVVATEIPSLRPGHRDATARLGFGCNVVAAFVVAFSVPYLLDAPYADLGSRVGFVFGAMAGLSGVFVWFCVPECKGLSLERVDALFEEGVGVRRFGGVPRGEEGEVREEEGRSRDGKRADGEKGSSAPRTRSLHLQD